jgi:hypothetical protein
MNNLNWYCQIVYAGRNMPINFVWYLHCVLSGYKCGDGKDVRDYNGGTCSEFMLV